MGYRMYVYGKNSGTLYLCGGKLYGYLDETNLESFKYLKSIGKLQTDECGYEALFDYGFDNKTELTNSEFAEFIKMYAEEYGKLTSWKTDVEGVRKAIESGENIVLEWG